MLEINKTNLMKVLLLPTGPHNAEVLNMWKVSEAGCEVLRHA